MKGGGTLDFIERWKVAVEEEKDQARRVQYRDSALILAELTRWQVTWLRGTEGWMARESQLIKSWIGEGRELGRVETKRANLITLIERLISDPVPEAIRLAIEGTNDLATLDRWYKAAFEAGTVANMRREMKLDP
jgi:hypothetical protein